ncbi:hypothetical protein CAPTEDRAFT_218040 [Capitella teleta]|uniref:Uncharacterized protein n=1 Tax=Capitella teleta TaxID=283909 RepID=R7TPE3_CAPTE|nr:hypothetical protein CAPTEDRAFT_218040 [Capitella teleta]|eukprot:ELT92910.1 hypothetical protein CAPTEDRAFT_218040 [Capitella teleta]
MGLLELGALLMVILTVGHFLVAWSIYAEQKFTKEDVFRSKKKMPKGNRKSRQNADEAFEAELQELLATIPRPQWVDLFPLCVIRGTISGVKGLVEWGQEVMRKKEEPIEEEDQEEIIKRPRRQRVQTPDAEFVAEMSEYQAPVAYQQVGEKLGEEEVRSNDKKYEEWTDTDSAMLAKGVAKFPGGSGHVQEAEIRNEPRCGCICAGNHRKNHREVIHEERKRN